MSQWRGNSDPASLPELPSISWYSASVILEAIDNNEISPYFEKAKSLQALVKEKTDLYGLSGELELTGS